MSSTISCTSNLGGVIVSYPQEFIVLIDCSKQITINGIPQKDYYISSGGPSTQAVTTDGSYALTTNPTLCPLLSYSLTADSHGNVNINQITG